MNAVWHSPGLCTTLSVNSYQLRVFCVMPVFRHCQNSPVLKTESERSERTEY